MKSPGNRGGLRFWLVIIALVFGRPDAGLIAAGAALVLAGAALHVWAKGCLHQNLEVTKAGPYRYVRHPFYSANALVDAGIAVMSGWWILWVALPMWWLAVYIPVIRSEEAYLTGQFGDAYNAYRGRVWMLVPLGRALPAEGGGFSWKNVNIAAGTTIPRALRIAAYPLAFATAAILRQRGLDGFVGTHSAGPAVLAGFVLLHGLAWQVANHLKMGRHILPPALAGGAARAVAAGVIVCMAAATTVAEIETKSIIIPAGALLLVASAIASRHGARGILMAECAALAACVVLCELPWLLPLPILYYTALILDGKLVASGTETPAARTQPVFATGSIPYAFIFVASIATAVAKGLIAG